MYDIYICKPEYITRLNDQLNVIERRRASISRMQAQENGVRDDIITTVMLILQKPDVMEIGPSLVEL